MDLDVSKKEYPLEGGLSQGTRIHLRATAKNGKSVDSPGLDISPVPTPEATKESPRISEFSAGVGNQSRGSRLSVKQGEVVTLRWKVSNAERVEIEPIGTVKDEGYYELGNLTKDEKYKLTAYNKGGQSATSWVSVTVVQAGRTLAHQTPTPTPKPSPTQTPAPALANIEEFYVKPQTQYRGSPVLIVWRVSNAVSVVIEPEIGPVSSQGHKEVHPTQTQTYTLTATNRDGKKEYKQVQIMVTEPPSEHQDTVQIVSIWPAVGTMFKRDQPIEFKVDLH